MTKLKQLMAERGVTQAELAKLTGLPKSTISQYMSGDFEPTGVRLELLAEALGCEPEEITKRRHTAPPLVEKLSVDDAANVLGMSPTTLRKGLRQGVFPWGYAVRTGEKTWAYWINKAKFLEVEGIKEVVVS